VIVAVTGGTGFLGRRIVQQLVGRGHGVRMLARRPWACGIPRGADITTVAGRLEDPASLEAWVAGATHVVHSAASVGSIDPNELQRTNVEGTRNVLAAAEKAGVQRFIHVSSIAATWRAAGLYGGSKKAAEDVVAASDLPWVMLRPPVILGPGSQVESKVATFARWRLVPTIAASGTMYPVHVDDVAGACIEALERAAVCGRRYELPGPEALNLADIQRRTLRGLGRRAVVIPVPPSLVKAASALLAQVTGATPIAADVIDAIAKGVEMDGSAAARDLGFQPRTI
jgi:nucleoside-diphosphate-sugar epimerase